MRLSAVIITHNEERNIRRCLQSLKGIADEIVVVDSGSTDGTERICREEGVMFQHHPWEGYSAQKNYAETLATGDWILSIDADEALSDTLSASIRNLFASTPDQTKVYSFNRLTNFCGKWIKHCGWYPDEKVRLWTRGTAQWDGVVHEQLSFSHHPQQERLQGDLLHYSYYNVTEFVERQIHYATLAAEKEYERGRRATTGAVVFKPFWKFIRDYIFKGGLFDGHAGFVICKTNAFYTFVKYATLRDRYSVER